MKKVLLLSIITLFLISSCASHKKLYGSIPLVNVGTSANTGTGDPLRTAFIKINEAITELNRIGIDNVHATSDELNILHGLDLNLVSIYDIAVMKAEISTLPVYADNAAALTGGLVAGQLYRTSIGVLMVVY
jgi:hypothetical protein